MTTGKAQKGGSSEEQVKIAAGGPQPVKAGSEADFEQKLSGKEEELKNAQDRILRLAAELDNTRKRLEREKTEGICYANENLIRDLLPVLDNLERAIRHGEQDANLEAVLEGVRMTFKGFLEVLGKHGCRAFESIGEQFDPNRHEAVLQQQSSEHPDMSVTQEFQKGYFLRDRLLRPAMVGVARQSKGESREEK